MTNSSDTSNHEYLTEELQKSRERTMFHWAEKEEWKKKYLLLKNSQNNDFEKDQQLPQSTQKISAFVQNKLERIFEYTGELDNFFQNNFNSLVKREILAKEKKIKNLQKKIKELGNNLRKSELNCLQQESDNENLKENSADIDVYRKKFIATNERIENLLKKEEEFMIRINSLQEKVSEQEEQIEELQKYPSTVSRLKHLLSQGAADFERIQEKYEKLKKKTTKQNKRNKKLKLSLMEKDNKVEALNKVIAGKNRHLAKLKAEQTEIIEDLKTQRDNLNDENSLLAKEIVELEKKLTQVNYDNQALQYELEKLKTRESQIDKDADGELKEIDLEELYEENKFLYESIELLENNNAKLEARIEKSNSYEEGSVSSEFSKRIDELAEVMNVVENKDNQDSRFNHIIEDVKKLKLENDELSARMKSLKNNLEKARDNIDQLASEKSKFELKIAFLEDENDNLTRKVKDSEDKELHKKLKDLEDRIAQLKTDKAQLEAKINKSSTRESNSENKKKIEELERRIMNLKSSCESYSKSLLEEKKQNTVVSNKLKILKEQLNKKVTMLEAGRNSLTSVMGSLDNCEFYMDSIEDSLLLEKDRNNQFASEIQTLKEQVRANIEEKNNIIDILNSKIDEMNYKIKEMDREDNGFNSKEIKKLQEVITQQNKQLAELEENNEKLETDLIVFDAKYSNFQKYVETISKVENELKLIGLMNAANELEEVAKLMTSDLRRDF
ncbi:MAG: hypothetical protein ACQES9_00235 [Myxococcota bacterium]